MKIPDEIIAIGDQLSSAGYKPFLVGGCVRDLALGNKPKDWDLASDALPDQVLNVFEHAHYDNNYGTVRIVNDETNDPLLKVVELTTFRREIGYSDDRRPDQVTFSTKIVDDLKRRDFTINALAYPLYDLNNNVFNPELVIDHHQGLEDLTNRLIKTVGDPNDRFGEDALRLLRAVRFAAQLDFAIESNTLIAITNQSERLNKIAVERITDEFNKLILTQNPAMGLEMLRRTGLLAQFIPELLEGVGVQQNQAHSYTVWEHLLRTLQAAADKNFDLTLRISALFHDIAKPRTREVSPETAQPTFYNHEVVGAIMTKKILKRLKYSRDSVSQITTFVRWHMFFSDPDEVTLAGVRRLIAKVGPDNIWDLVNLRICDRIGTGRPKEQPYRLRKFKAMIEEAVRQPTTVKMLKINGDIIINHLNVKPGRIIGDILHIILDQVLEDPNLNNLDYQLLEASRLIELDNQEREKLTLKAKENLRKIESDAIQEIRHKHHVR
jgi:poly(A) polymerase/tRNA nucleotidyltransferase (CCA-adding enzyme)